MPKIHNLHPFGCSAFWFEPDSNKLKSKAKEDIYVGSEFSGGHIILNPNTQQTVVRRDVRFQENSFSLKLQAHALHSTRQVIKTALSGPRASDWNSAMDEEINNMIRNKVWALVPRAEAMGKVMTGKWALKEKPNEQLK